MRQSRRRPALTASGHGKGYTTGALERSWPPVIRPPDIQSELQDRLRPGQSVERAGTTGQVALAGPPTVTRLRELPLRVGPELVCFALALAIVRDLTLLVILPAAVVVWRACGLYSRRFTLSVLDDVPNIGLGVLCGLAFSGLVDWGAPYSHVALCGAVLFGAEVLARCLAYAMIRSARKNGLVSYPALLLGCGRIALSMVQRAATHPDTGLRPVGFLDDDPGRYVRSLPAPWLGTVHDLERVLNQVEVSDVIVCDGSVSTDEVLDRIRTCGRQDVDIHVVPRLAELHRSTVGDDQIWGVPLQRLRPYNFKGLAWRAKRMLDVVVSGAALLVLAPVVVCVAAAVRWELGPGIIFRQERVGLDGRTFTVRKFRSMPAGGQLEKEWAVSAELGRVGSFIRRYSLDEIPQLFNVLLGDMSLVGPRPERPDYDRKFSSEIDGYRHRHRVPAGLTGLAAVEGLRGDTSLVDRAYFDNYYIEHWSLWLDLKILMRTVTAIVRGTGT